MPNLYAADEIEKIVGLVRPLAKAAGKLETRDAILQHYVQLVRENLHVVLCMSPIGAGFRNRCRMFPSLVNCCTVDWFNVREPWWRIETPQKGGCCCHDPARTHSSGQLISGPSQGTAVFPPNNECFHRLRPVNTREGDSATLFRPVLVAEALCFGTMYISPIVAQLPVKIGVTPTII